MRIRVRSRAHSMYSGYEYEKEYQTVKEGPKLRLRRGDVVQVSGACKSRYARNQIGVVVDRYKWIKYKYQRFVDYGATIMFLTGDKKGCLKKFYGCSMGQLSKVIY